MLSRSLLPVAVAPSCLRISPAPRLSKLEALERLGVADGELIELVLFGILTAPVIINCQAFWSLKQVQEAEETLAHLTQLGEL